MTDICDGCKQEFTVPVIARVAVNALGLEGCCPDCIGRGIKWAIKNSKK